MLAQEKQKKEAANGKGVKQSAGEIRLQKGAGGVSFATSVQCLHTACHTAPWPCGDWWPSGADISELNLSKGMSIKFPEGKDKLLVFEITMKPDEGIYRCCPLISAPLPAFACPRM